MSGTEATESRRPRAGRRFEPIHELELADSAMRAVDGLPGARRGALVVREMTGPLGIPDFTALVGPREALNDRLAASLPAVVSRTDAEILGALSVHAPHTSEFVASRIGLRSPHVQRRLVDLARRGCAIEGRADRFVRHPSIRPLGRLYAIEMKVKDWRQAIRQARTYRTWADSYVLVTSELGIRQLAELIAEVDSDKGGLVVADRWIRRPRVQRHSLARRLWAMEHFVAAVQDHQPSSSM